jgi:hypothetical protein
MIRKADFLIAGVQKAGTTALHHFLSKHPDVFMPVRKELHFFDDESIDWQQVDCREYDAHFGAAKEFQVAGEATPIYTFWPPALQRIARYNPRIRLIVILRNPIARALSHWSMEIDRGQETLDFQDAIRAGRARAAVTGGIMHDGMRHFSYVERGWYAEQVKRIKSLFPAQQVLYCTNEAMRADFQGFFARVTDFLGLERKIIAKVYDVRPLPPGPSRQSILRGDDEEYLRRLYAEDIAETEALTGLDLNEWKQGPRIFADRN